MDLGLAGAAVLVVGGSRGIGRACALRFAEEGASVAIAARDPAVLDEAAAEIHARPAVRPLAVRCDCAKPAEVDALMAEVVGALGRLDVLVNSVGAAKGGRFLDLGEADWMESLDGKLHAQIRCCRAALPYLRRRGEGAIVNVIGHRGKQPDGRALPAGVANAGLMNFTIGLAAEEARARDPGGRGEPGAGGDAAAAVGVRDGGASPGGERGGGAATVAQPRAAGAGRRRRRDRRRTSSSWRASARASSPAPSSTATEVRPGPCRCRATR